MTAESVTNLPDLITMAGPVAYAKAVGHAQAAALAADRGSHERARTYAAVAQAFAAIATAEATARVSADFGHHPDGGWQVHTHPGNRPWWDR
ncbi:hypothetical protein ACFVY0_40430 [Streptomyces sp. NPDC058286]|uniref:hypothetical protein n=1 Tax=Streptomyces sp. NPDC058286 TaxID=3346422 RepID=UPI0036EA7573